MVTILLAAYQGEAYIGQQLDSLLNQTVKDIRIVISDDGSGDNTRNVIEDYQNRYPEKIYLCQWNSPSGSAKNNFLRLLHEAWRCFCVKEDGNRFLQAGVEPEEEEYIMLCDQDDFWLPQKVEKTLERMKKVEKKRGTDCPVLVFSDLTVVDEKLAVIHPSMAEYTHTPLNGWSFGHYLVENNVSGCTAMLNCRLLSYFSYIPPETVMHDWWLAMLASAFGEVSAIEESLILYRQHGDNQMGAKNAADVSQYVERLTAQEQVKENYRKMFAQARYFLLEYEGVLKKKEKYSINGFIEIENSGRIKKIRNIFRYRLFKSTWYRTLGQCFSI